MEATGTLEGLRLVGARIIGFGQDALRSCLRAIRQNMTPTRFEVVVLLIAAGMIVYQNFVPPLIGLADNGDFGRFFPQNGLTHMSTEYDDRYFLHFNSKYRVVQRMPGLGWYKSSTSILVRTARGLSIAAGQRQFFDIRVLAALYAALLLIGVWLILVAARSLGTGLRLVLAVLLIIILTDAGYVAYFNSLYAEGTALAFLAIGMGCSLVLIAQRSSSVLLLIGYFGAIAMAVGSKTQYIPLVPAFALFGVYLCRFVGARWRYWLSGALAVALCCLAAWSYKRIPPVMNVHAAYIQIFMDFLPNSSTPQQDLSEIGLNPDFAAYSGTTPFQRDSPLNDAGFQAEFSAKVTSYTIPRFYLTHPRRLYELCVRCAKHAFSTRVPHLGYYEASTGKAPRAHPFGVWSSIRETIFPRTWSFLAFFFSTGIAAAVLFMKAPLATLKGIHLLYLLFVFIAGAQFLVSVVAGGGEPDLEKHLFMFNLAFDACLILSVLGAAHLIQTYRPLFLRSDSR